MLVLFDELGDADNEGDVVRGGDAGGECGSSISMVERISVTVEE